MLITIDDHTILSEFLERKQFELQELYNANINSIIDFTKHLDKSQVTIYCKKCDSGFYIT